MEQKPSGFFKTTFQLMITCLALFIGDYLLDGFWSALWLSFVISLTHLFLGGSTKVAKQR